MGRGSSVTHPIAVGILEADASRRSGGAGCETNSFGVFQVGLD
jgi:hypothetical protein